MFTVMFAIARTVGLGRALAGNDRRPGMRIGRPRQLYTGSTKRDYLDVGARK